MSGETRMPNEPLMVRSALTPERLVLDPEERRLERDLSRCLVVANLERDGAAGVHQGNIIRRGEVRDVEALRFVVEELG